MTKFKLSMLLLFAVFTSALFAQPPAPELLYRQTEPNPAFIKVSGITADFADAEDYIFVYGSANRCYGATKIYFDPVFVVAMGNDSPSGVSGFAPGEVMRVGIYDTQSNKFYELSGQAYNYITNKGTALTWHPLSIYTYEVTHVVRQIELTIDNELAAVKLGIEAPSIIKVKEGNQLFISIDEQNLKNVTLTHTGSGTLEKVKRWVTGQGWVTYLYTLPENDETNITFTATAQSAWDRSIVIATHEVTVDREFFEQNQGVVYTGKYFRIVRDTGGLYLETTTTHGVRLIYKIGNKTYIATVHNARTKPGDRVLITADDVDLYLLGTGYMGTKSYKDYIDEGEPGSFWSRTEYIKETLKQK